MSAHGRSHWTWHLGFRHDPVRAAVATLFSIHAMAHVVPDRFRAIVAGAVGMIAADDLAALRAHPQIRIRGQDPLVWVRDYPAAITALPAEVWDIADAVEVEGSPGTWSLVVPLWTVQEGRSDLSLEATAQDLATGPVITIDGIHVL
jgi:hypothetical protein